MENTTDGQVEEKGQGGMAGELRDNVNIATCSLVGCPVHNSSHSSVCLKVVVMLRPFVSPH